MNMSASEVVEQLLKSGATIELEGQDLVVSSPEPLRPSVEKLLPEARRVKAEILEIVREWQGTLAPPECPPLPPGVRLLRYAPKTPPVAVQPCSIVTDVDKFIGAYLRDLAWRLAHPNTYACASLPEILAKLADVGVELEIEQAEVLHESHPR